MYLSEFDQNMQNMIVSKCILWEFDQNMQNMIVSKCILWELDQTYAKHDSFIVYLLDFDRNMIVS